MWFIGVEVEQETSAPPPKKILDPPLVWVEVASNDFIINLTDLKQQHHRGIAPFKDSSLRRTCSVDPCSLLLLNSL